MPKAQLDMFAPAEAELFDPQRFVVYPDEGRVRGKLARMLAELQAATGPLDWERRGYLEKVVPQMSLALPETERAEVRQAFAAELARLG